MKGRRAKVASVVHEARPLHLVSNMKTDPVGGKTFRWTFTDGPMAKKTFEHSFEPKGSVTFRSIDGDTKGKPTEIGRYSLAQVSGTVCAVSYLSSGYTLTVVLDFETDNLFAFSSNEMEMTLQHGTFEEITEGQTAELFHRNKAANGSPARR